MRDERSLPLFVVHPSSFILVMAMLAAVACALKPVQEVTAGAPFNAVIGVSSSFRYAGTQSFDFYGRAHAQQHFFVDADADGLIRRMYWIQFENYLTDNSDRYQYPPPNDTLGNAQVTSDVRFRPKGTTPSPDSDAGRAIALLATRNLRFADENLRARFICIPDSSARTEIMIIYQEDARLHGSKTPDAGFMTRAKSNLRFAAACTAPPPLSP